MMKIVAKDLKQTNQNASDEKNMYASRIETQIPLSNFRLS